MIESQLNYMVDACEHRRARPGHVEVRPDEQRSYNADLQADEAARSGTPAAAPAGTWTSTATTPRCGRASPSSSAQASTAHASTPRAPRRPQHRRHRRQGARRMTDCSGKVAVVTGAGSGIGRALALELAAPGRPAGAVRRRRRGLAETARLVEAPAPTVQRTTLDVPDRAACSLRRRGRRAVRRGQHGDQQRRHRLHRRRRAT